MTLIGHDLIESIQSVTTDLISVRDVDGKLLDPVSPALALAMANSGCFEGVSRGPNGRLRHLKAKGLSLQARIAKHEEELQRSGLHDGAVLQPSIDWLRTQYGAPRELGL